MGLFSSNDSFPVLHPFNPPLGVHPHFCVGQETVLVLKEKAFSFSGDDFSVKDGNGVEVVRCQGKTFGLGDQKTFVGTRQDGVELFQVRASLALMGTKMVATFVNAADGAPIELSLRGNLLGGHATIELSGRPVAHITRKLWTGREVFADKQTYFVTVAPGVDLALIAAISVCFDEKAHENH